MGYASSLVVDIDYVYNQLKSCYILAGCLFIELV
jgi:hypothetical protein